MSAVFAPYGFLPTTQDQAAESYARNYPNSLPATGSAFNLFQGQPLTYDVNGYLAPALAVTDAIVGIFAGLEYADPTTRVPVVTNRYVSGQQFLGFLDPTNQIVCRVLVYDVQNTIFRCQASGAFATPVAGSVPMPQTGEEFNLDVTTQTVTNPDGSIFPFAGNTTPLNQSGNFIGVSYACISPTRLTPAPGVVGQFVLWGNAYLPGNQLSDTFPQVLVKVNLSTKYPALVPPTL